jgi:leucyl aminopeptidase (aminopeptidase T)
MSEYEALAKTVLKKTLRVKAGENVIVETWGHGLPIAGEFVYQLRALGARPLLAFEDEDTFWRAASTLPPSKLGKVGEHEWAAMKEADAYVFITGPADITKIRAIGIDKYNAAIGYNSEWYKRAKRYKIRGARIGLGYASEERARSYGFDLQDWRHMLLDASSVDPAEIRKRGTKLRRLLSTKGHVEITHPNGTRFECDLAGRHAGLEDGVLTPQNVKDGENMVNIPAGEAFVAPAEKSGQGTIRFDRPIANLGRWIRGITFAFDGGRVKWNAEENGDLVRPQWEKGTAGRDLLGLIDFGLNPRARTGFLQDHLVAGNVYVSIGNNEEWGGTNKSSFSFEGNLTGATVTIGGKTVLRDGLLVP